MTDIKPKLVEIVCRFLARHWWKVAVIILATAFAVSGFQCPTPWGVFSKTKVIEKKVQ